MVAVGVFFDYFAAASDEEAAAVIDRVGGPGSQAVVEAQPPERKGIFGRQRARSPEPVFARDPELVIHDTVSVKGIDPVVQQGTLEALLTGRPYDDVVEDPRSGQVLSVRDEGERVW